VNAARPKLPVPVPAPLHLDSVGAQTLELQRVLRKGERRFPVLVASAALGLVVIGGAFLYLKNRTPNANPALVAEDQAALELIKRDDEESLTTAISLLATTGARSPEYVPVMANELMAHVLVTQDLREEIRRLQAQAAAAEQEMRQLEERKESPDWPNRVNAKREEMIKLKEQTDPIVDAASKHDERAGELLKASKALADRLGSAGDGAAVLRASALYYAFKGNESAVKLAESYRRSEDERKILHDPSRAFADLALAALYAQPRTSAEMRAKGLAAADAALKKDPKLLRAHLLLAKIHASDQPEAARRALDDLLLINSQHAAAQRLKDEIEQQAAKLSLEGAAAR
jgi:hypothetical protein